MLAGRDRYKGQFGLSLAQQDGWPGGVCWGLSLAQQDEEPRKDCCAGQALAEQDDSQERVVAAAAAGGSLGNGCDRSCEAAAIRRPAVLVKRDKAKVVKRESSRYQCELVCVQQCNSFLYTHSLSSRALRMYTVHNTR